MGRVIRIAEINGQGSSLSGQVSMQDANLSGMISAIENYTSDEELDGNAWNANKNFFVEVHTVVLDMMKLANKILVDAHNSFAGSVGGEDLDEEELKRDQALYKNLVDTYWNQYAHWSAQAALALGTGLFGYRNAFVATSNASSAWEHWHTNNELLDKIEQKIDKLNEIDTATASMFDYAKEMQLSLSRAITEINGAWKTNGFNSNLVGCGWFKRMKAQCYYAEAVQYGVIKIDEAGVITYQWDVIENLMQMDATEVTEAEYMALIQAYESVINNRDAKSLEKYLNACYIIREMQEPKKEAYMTDTANPMNAYNYFNRQSQAKSGIYDEMCLSPIFREMEYYYINYVVSDELLSQLYNNEMTKIDEKNFEEKMFAAGILSNVEEYGDITKKIQDGDVYLGPISVERLDDKDYILRCEFNINNSTDRCKIVQHGYTGDTGNLANANYTINKMLTELKKEYNGVVSEEVKKTLFGEVINGLGMIVPKGGGIIKNSYMIAETILAIDQTMEQNAAIESAQNMLDYAECSYAMAIEQQMCTVNGEYKVQYACINMEKLNQNISKYNEETNNYITYQDVLSDNDLLRDFANFTMYYSD